MSHSKELKEKKKLNRKGDAYQMCKAITDMINDGIEKEKIASVDRSQKKLGLSLQEACDVEEISVDEYKKAKARLQTEV